MVMKCRVRSKLTFGGCNMQKRVQLPYINLLKSIAIYFVVFYHGALGSADFLTAPSWETYLRYFFRTFLCVCVPLFFFINGYLLFRGELNLRKHLCKTIKYVAITVIWGIVTLVFRQVIDNEYLSVTEFIRALVNWKQGWINHLWYMGALVCIYVFFPLLKHVFDSNKTVFYYFVVITGFLTFGNTCLNQIDTGELDFFTESDTTLIGYNFFNIFNPYREIRGYAFVYFCLGGIAYDLTERINNVPARKRNIISVVCILLSCAGLFGTGVFYSEVSGSLFDVVWNGYDTVFALVNVVAVFVLSLNYRTDNIVIRNVSANTLGIYFIHPIILTCIGRLLAQHGFVMPSGIRIVYVVVVVLICSALSSAIRKIPVLSGMVR